MNNRFMRIIRIMLGLPDPRATEADEASEKLRQEHVVNVIQAVEVMEKDPKRDTLVGSVIHDMRHNLQRLNALMGD